LDRHQVETIFKFSTLTQPLVSNSINYGRGGQLAARGPHVARHSIFSGPRKHSGNIFRCEFCVSLHLLHTACAG